MAQQDYNLPVMYNYVKTIRNNTRDSATQSFIIQTDMVDVVRWCRRNFGDRGDGWDFTAGTKSVEIKIWSSKLITMWKMWKE